MQFHGKKICTFLVIFMMIAALLSSYGMALPTPTASAASATSTVKLSISNTSSTWKQITELTSLVEQSSSSTNSCGVQPTDDIDRPNQIRDIIDKLPTIPADSHVSDPFVLLANEVSYREENNMRITPEDLVTNCSEDFNPETGGMAYNLVYLNHGDNWLQILTAYQVRYDKDYPAIQSALYKLKDQATKYAKDHNIATGELLEPTPGSPGSGTVGGTPPTPEPMKLTLGIKSIDYTQAILHIQGGRSAKLFIYDASTNKKLSESRLINEDDATITLSELTPGSSYELRLVDQNTQETVQTRLNTKGKIRLGVYKSTNDKTVNAYGEKMYVQYNSYFGQKYRILPPNEVPNALYDAPASILDDPEWQKHYVLMTQQQWLDTSFSDPNVASNASEWLDRLQTALDFAGMIPVFGEPIDGANSIIYWVRGDKVSALISAGAMIPFVGDGITGVKLAARGIKEAEELAHTTKFIEKEVKATGQLHHILSNKTMKALNEHPVLADVFKRNDEKFIYRAADEEAHKGYQTWHRAVDDEVVQWLSDNPNATKEDFIAFLNEIYNRPGIKEKIPGVNIE